MSYEIRLPQFEGPFDLLLFFIERDELDIHEISIARITDDFLAYLQQMASLNIELASEFILVAATLMRIKARLLLPRPDLNVPIDELDPAAQLIARLLKYKRFKDTVPALVQLEDDRQMRDKRGNIPFEIERVTKFSFPNEELESLSLYQLLLTWSRITKRNADPIKQVSHTVVQYPYTIEKQKAEILLLLSINDKLNFSSIQLRSDSKIHLVYSFLAILELLQQELLQIEIGLGFNNFWISPK